MRGASTKGSRSNLQSLGGFKFASSEKFARRKIRRNIQPQALIAKKIEPQLDIEKAITVQRTTQLKSKKKRDGNKLGVSTVNSNQFNVHIPTRLH